MMNKLMMVLASLCVSTTALAQTNTLRLDTPWARATVAGQGAAGVFVTIENTGATADRLIGGSTPAAASLELHTMTMDGNVMRMQQVQAIDLPAKQAVALKPGGLHLMLQGLKAPLRAGSSIALTLKFEKAGEIKTSALVQAMGASAPAAGMAGHQH